MDKNPPIVIKQSLSGNGVTQPETRLLLVFNMKKKYNSFPVTMCTWQWLLACPYHPWSSSSSLSSSSSSAAHHRPENTTKGKLNTPFGLGPTNSRHTELIATPLATSVRPSRGRDTKGWTNFCANCRSANAKSTDVPPFVTLLKMLISSSTAFSYPLHHPATLKKRFKRKESFVLRTRLYCNMSVGVERLWTIAMNENRSQILTAA